MKKILPILLLITFMCGCGYTTGSLLPPHIKKIHVKSFTNSIDITEEESDKQVYRTYRPRMEADITNAVIDKFIFDGHLKIVSEADADVILTGELMDFKREATRYDDNENVEQYRLAIITNINLKETDKKKPLWDIKGFAGSANYYVSGIQAKSEDAAMQDAIDDLARRIVEQTIEVW